MLKFYYWTKEGLSALASSRTKVLWKAVIWKNRIAILNSCLTNLCCIGQNICFFHQQRLCHPLEVWHPSSSFARIGVLASSALEHWHAPSPGFTHVPPVGIFSVVTAEFFKGIAANHQFSIPNHILMTDTVSVVVSAYFLIVAPLLTRKHHNLQWSLLFSVLFFGDSTRISDADSSAF